MASGIKVLYGVREESSTCYCLDRQWYTTKERKQKGMRNKYQEISISSETEIRWVTINRVGGRDGYRENMTAFKKHMKHLMYMHIYFVYISCFASQTATHTSVREVNYSRIG